MVRNTLFLSACCLFFTNAGIYLLRPHRDEIGIINGIEHLPWFFSSTFALILLMHFGFRRWVERFPHDRSLLLQYVMLVFIPLWLLISFPDLQNSSLFNYLFFAWVSMLNLWMISIAWDLVTDIYSLQAAATPFAKIAFAGTAGNLTGYAASMVVSDGVLIVAGVAFVFACLCSLLVQKNIPENENYYKKKTPFIGTIPVKKSVVFYIGPVIFIYALLSTLLYFGQAHMISTGYNSNDYKNVFAYQGLIATAVVMCFQWFITPQLISKRGWASSVNMLPLLLIGGLTWFCFSPSLTGIAVLMAIHRTGSFALLRPSREMWFTMLPSNQKSRIKNFLDTVVYRGGDVAGSWIYLALYQSGCSFVEIAAIAILISLLWWFSIFLLNKKDPRESGASKLIHSSFHKL